jgi:hypothetical protein
MGFVIPSKTLVENYPYISQHDPAVNTDDPDFEHKWKLYTDGAEPRPPLRPGAKPVEWQMRHITTAAERAKIADAEDREGMNSAVLVAAAIALVDAKGLSDDKGNKVEFPRQRDGKVDCLADEVMLRLPPKVLFEIGMVAIKRMALDPLS